MALNTEPRLLPPRDLAPARRRRLRPPLAGELLVVLLLVRVYDWVKAAAASLGMAALGHAHTLLNAERVLRLDVERWADRGLAAHHRLSLLASWYYQYTHIGVALLVLGGCYLLRPHQYRAARNTLVLTNGAGLVVFVLYPVMPPRLLPGGGYPDVVAMAGFGSTHGGPVPADQFAAMPSLHVAWAVWVALVVFRAFPGRRWSWAAFGYPVLTTAVVVATGNHYVLDVAAGLVVTVGAALLTGLLPGVRRAQSP